jgi:hypothetical protein
MTRRLRRAQEEPSSEQDPTGIYLKKLFNFNSSCSRTLEEAIPFRKCSGHSPQLSLEVGEANGSSASRSRKF